MAGEHSKYGFRYDPHQWINSNTSVCGALVRTRIFDSPRTGDHDLLDGAMAEILARQQPDGRLGQDSKETGSLLLDLLKLGIETNRPEVQRAAKAILSQMHAGDNAGEWYEEDGRVLSIYALHALSLLRIENSDEVSHSVKWLVENPHVWNDPWKGCPWTPAVFWSALWEARSYGDVEQTLRNGLRSVLEQMNAAGCCAYNDPWGFTEAASYMDLPEAKQLISRQIPMILRNQRPDGGWCHRSPETLRALMMHGFFQQLCDTEPLPPDWRIMKEVPLPEGKWSSLTWDGNNFWSLEKNSHIASAFSPEDGRVIKRIDVPDGESIAWWNDALAVVGNEPKQLRIIDPDSNNVLRAFSLDHLGDVCDCETYHEKVIVGDGVECNIAIVDPISGQTLDEHVLAGPGPGSIAAQGDTLWHIDFWAHALIQTDTNGHLLDWGEKPCWHADGIAFDGKRLWVLDGDRYCICAIKKAYIQ